MVGKRGKGSRKISAREEVIPDDPASDRSLSDSQIARIRLRQRWELASVLNFFHVFQPLIKSDLNISAEEIEAALITPNDALARLHIAVLKGIPPINKNMADADVWVTVVCKKLATWWPWVAEGENPLKTDHGKEILRYKELDPTTRMLILKALCEVRGEQDDVLRYITDELKKGTKVTTFRKERIGSDGNGITYWYDGDPVIGHRLYREIVKVESKQKRKGKDHATQPTIDSQWETLATDLEEIQEISGNLSSSKIMAEAAVGEIIKLEIVPVLEELQKKKERAMKRQQRQALQLNGFLNSNTVGITRSCRQRRPVSDTFDEYDRSINEALQISKKLKTAGSHKDSVKQVEHASGQKDVFLNGSDNSDQGNSSSNEVHESLAEIEDDSEYQSGNDDEDDDYSEEHNESNGEDDDDDDDDNYDSGDSDDEKGHPPKPTHLRPVQNQKDLRTNVVAGLRRSQRAAEPTKGHAEMKKRLRQRPTCNNADLSSYIVSDSEDNSSENDKQTEMVIDTETEASAASSDGLQVDSADDSYT